MAPLSLDALLFATEKILGHAAGVEQVDALELLLAQADGIETAVATSSAETTLE